MLCSIFGLLNFLALLLDFLELRDEGVTKVVQVMDLFEGRKAALRMQDLLLGKHKLSTDLAFDLVFLWKVQCGNLRFGQTVTLFVLSDLLFPLSRGHVVAGVDDEVVLALDFGTLLLDVVPEDFVKVHVQSHELGKALLAKETLRLQVHL